MGSWRTEAHLVIEQIERSLHSIDGVPVDDAIQKIESGAYFVSRRTCGQNICVMAVHDANSVLTVPSLY
jgi:hypothetical protein